MPIVVLLPTVPWVAKQVLPVARNEARVRTTKLEVFDYLYTDGNEKRAADWRRRRGDKEALADLFAALDLDPPRDQEECLIQKTGREAAAAALLEYATSSSASLIVLAVPQRSPVGKLLLGSEAQTVLLNAVCPVLTVPISGQGA